MKTSKILIHTKYLQNVFIIHLLFPFLLFPTLFPTSDIKGELNVKEEIQVGSIVNAERYLTKRNF